MNSHESIPQLQQVSVPITLASLVSTVPNYLLSPSPWIILKQTQHQISCVIQTSFVTVEDRYYQLSALIMRKRSLTSNFEHGAAKTS